MSKLVSIGEAAKILSVSISTLRRWEASGRLKAERTPGGQRRYELGKLRPELYREADPADRKTLAYTCVGMASSADDLNQQKQILDEYCSRQGWKYEIITDTAFGFDYQRSGLKQILKSILNGQVGRLVITRKDRLVRLGADLVFAVCEAKQVEVVILNQGPDANFDADLENDINYLVELFSARLYGGRSHKIQYVLKNLQHAVESKERDR